MNAKRGNKYVFGFKRSTALTLFLKRLQRKEGEINAMFLKRGRAEYAALSVLEKQKLAREAANPALPNTLEQKKKYLKQLVDQLKKVGKVLLHIGVEYYFEMQLDGQSHLLAHDDLFRNVLAERPSVVSDLKYLRQCVQKIFNEAYGRALGREECNVRFPYKKHSLAPVVIVTGMPEGVNLKHPSFYGISTLRKIISKKEMIKMELIAQSEAGEPSLPQAPVGSDIFVASDPASEVVQNTLGQDIEAEEPSLPQAPVVSASEVVQNTLVQDIEAGEPSLPQAPVVSASEVVQNTLVQDIEAGEPSLPQAPVVSASEVVQNTLVQDIEAGEPSLPQAPVVSASEVVQNTLVQDIEAGEPSLPQAPVVSASEVVQNTLVQDIEAGESSLPQAPVVSASEVVQNTLVQDMEEVPASTLQLSTVMKSAKQHQQSREKSQRTGVRTLWSAPEILVVQQHFSQELAGLKPVKRSSIDSFLAQQTVVKRTATALGNYLLRNRKKIRQDDQ